MSAGAVSIVVDEPAWRTSGVRFSRLRATARLAFDTAEAKTRRDDPAPSSCALTLLLAGDERLRVLNAAFRDTNRATNVLAFPAVQDSRGYLGDIAIAFGVTSAESATAGITLEEHTLHLVAHGVLHLLGYDHLRPREAKRMERLEIAILDRLGVADPYARAAPAR